MKTASEKSLAINNLNHFRAICLQGWCHTLLQTDKVKRALQQGVFRLLTQKLQKWHTKFFAARNRMFRSTSSTEENEEGSNVDAANKHNTDLYVPVKSTQWPIVYGPEYNIGFLGLERLHPFDAGKWGKVYNFLKEDGLIRDDTTIRPKEATEEDLRVVHSKRYINSLKWSIEVAGITEVPPVAILPNFIVQRKVLRPFRYQTGGTILAAKLAMERGWGINLGGGFHHCSSERGGGFCAYADITLAIKFLFERMPGVKKAMIIDLDAHQGNGHERDFMSDSNVYIMDVYNRAIYPHDGFAKRAIKRKIELTSYTEDSEYLDLVRTNVEGALNEFDPDIIVYNAGTDILEGDPLGHLSITPNGIIERDQIVFENAMKRKIPIMMVTSGGYQRTTARIIADSIKNLKTQKLISCDEAENAPEPVAENQRSLGIPRSQSESGLFAKLRGYCFSKSPTQESVPAPSDSNVMTIPTLSSTKSASDLDLQGQRNSEPNTEESAVEFLARKSEESFVESLGIDFTAKKSHSYVTGKGSNAETIIDSALPSIPVDDKQNGNGCEVETTANSPKVIKNNSSEDFEATCSDKWNETKGARSKIGLYTDCVTAKKLKEKQIDPENTKTDESDISEASHSNESEDVATKDKHIVKPREALSENSNRGTNQVTASDVYNNNVYVTAVDEVSLSTQHSDWNSIEKVEEENRPRAFDAEMSDDEWSDFVEYNPENK